MPGPELEPPGPELERKGNRPMDGDDGLDRRLERIEEIVRTLDSDLLGLDEALALFEEGVGHLRHAERILLRTELRIRELVGEGADGLREVGMAGTEDDE